MHLDYGLSIMVIGDVMLDSYIFGEVSRISPEAPVPVVEVKKRKVTLGGAGNVALNLVGLGIKTSLFGVVGDDRDGHLVSGILKSSGIVDHLYHDERVPTTVKTRVVASNQQLLRFDEEGNFNGHGPGCPLNGITTILGTWKIDAVVLSDYDKGVLDLNLATEVISICKSKKIKVIVDPKRGDWSAFQGADLVKPNLSELWRSEGHWLSDNYDSIASVARRAMLRYSLGAVLVTMGSRGMMLVTENRREFIPTVAREVFDVSGAGDTVIAVLAACLGSNYTLSEAAKFANMAAGIVVGKFGTYPISLEEMKDLEFGKNDSRKFN